MISVELKKKIAAAIAADFENFAGSMSQHAGKFGISASVYNRIKNGETDRVLADAKWVNIGRKLNVVFGDGGEWKTARTPVYVFIEQQLEFCQQNSGWALLADEAGIGKTYTARQYAKTHKNVIYVDCSQVKSKNQFIRYIAKEFGLDYVQRLYDVEQDLIYYIKTVPQPLIILDEAGDLHYEAFLELKTLWNATEGCCAWYVMGADGLREKINRGIRNKKVGFAEIFDRLGARAQRITPDGKQEREDFFTLQAAAVIKANAPEADVKDMLARTDCHLRRVYIEVMKKR